MEGRRRDQPVSHSNDDSIDRSYLSSSPSPSLELSQSLRFIEAYLRPRDTAVVDTSLWGDDDTDDDSCSQPNPPSADMLVVCLIPADYMLNPVTPCYFSVEKPDIRPPVPITISPTNRCLGSCFLSINDRSHDSIEAVEGQISGSKGRPGVKLELIDAGSHGDADCVQCESETFMDGFCPINGCEQLVSMKNYIASAAQSDSGFTQPGKTGEVAEDELEPAGSCQLTSMDELVHEVHEVQSATPVTSIEYDDECLPSLLLLKTRSEVLHDDDSLLSVTSSNNDDRRSPQPQFALQCGSYENMGDEGDASVCSQTSSSSESSQLIMNADEIMGGMVHEVRCGTPVTAIEHDFGSPCPQSETNGTVNPSSVDLNQKNDGVRQESSVPELKEASFHYGGNIMVPSKFVGNRMDVNKPELIYNVFSRPKRTVVVNGCLLFVHIYISVLQINKCKRFNQIELFAPHEALIRKRRQLPAQGPQMKRRAPDEAIPVRRNRWEECQLKITSLVGSLSRELHVYDVATTERREGPSVSMETARKQILELEVAVQAKQRIDRLKRKIKGTLLDVQNINSNDRQWPHLAAAGTVDGCNDAEGNLVDVETVMCSVCGTADNEDNDILLCDKKGCCRAYHQYCLDPPVVQIDTSVDWFCHVCQTIDSCLDYLEARLDYDPVGEVDELFPELEREPVPTAVNGGLSDEDESDEDYQPKVRRVEESDRCDVEMVAEATGSAKISLVDPDNDNTTADGNHDDNASTASSSNYESEDLPSDSESDSEIDNDELAGLINEAYEDEDVQAMHKSWTTKLRSTRSQQCSPDLHDQEPERATDVVNIPEVSRTRVLRSRRRKAETIECSLDSAGWQNTQSGFDSFSNQVLSGPEDIGKLVLKVDEFGDRVIVHQYVVTGTVIGFIGADCRIYSKSANGDLVWTQCSPGDNSLYDDNHDPEAVPDKDVNVEGCADACLTNVTADKDVGTFVASTQEAAVCESTELVCQDVAGLWVVKFTDEEADSLWILEASAVK
jgi:hypothetical protein